MTSAAPASPASSPVSSHAAPDDDAFVLAGRRYRSRLIVGTGKYRDFDEMGQALIASGAEIVTVAVRRVNLSDPTKERLTDHIDPKKTTFLPNTAGCFTADFGLEIATDTREISAAGSALHVCEANCPDSGEGLIAWGSGSTLAWRYTGKGKVVVRGPKGRVFNVTQACANK